MLTDGPTCFVFVKPFPGHALHENSLQRYLGFGTLVSNQERRAAIVPQFNRWFCSPIGLHRISYVRASRDTPRKVFFDCFERKRDGCILVETTRRRPVLPVPAPPRCPAVRRPAPNRPWYVWVLVSTRHKRNGISRNRIKEHDERLTSG